jgi:hypothetical protein
MTAKIENSLNEAENMAFPASDQCRQKRGIFIFRLNADSKEAGRGRG